MAIWSYMRGPGTLDIKVGYRCNNRCAHCVVKPVVRRLEEDNEKSDLTTQEVLDLIDGAREAGANTIVLTGGEVTIRKDFQRLVTYAVESGMEVNIQTNGRLLSQMKNCEFLADLPGLLFIVALHASKAEIHDRITKHTGSFRQTVTAIRNLRSIDKEVAAKIVLSKFNRGELLSTALLAMQLGANEFCVAFPHALDFPVEQFQETIPTYFDVRDEVRALSEFSEREGFPATFETIPYCILPETPAFWRRNCDLLSKASFEPSANPVCAPSVQEDRFDWEELRPQMKEKAVECRTCVFDQLCEGPWREYVENYGSGEFAPVAKENATAFLGAN